MNRIERIEHWGDTHHPKWVDIVRIGLGIFLCYKGIDFLRNMGIMTELISGKLSYGSFFIVMLGHYIVFAHILGGIFLTLGAFTRFACLIQIPILLGAIIFINFSQDVLRPYSGFILSILVLLLLVYFLVAGNGPIAFSFDEKEEKVKK
ncbi:DoxX family protein [Segetibacter sp.]|jgi:putative oxidoreductase|uniref:DoxX family protein n=1 Tax=Segetibacter sp. TaxID=2231182 RepID=UPI00260E9C81|nr:DoxX family protein [Segetibacter sp.]MCW3081891.1 DoxX family protein [Segetibacter sp.]